MIVISSLNTRKRTLLLLFIAVLFLGVGAAAWVVLADKERVEADREKRIALARELAEGATAQMPRDPELALLLAREAERVWHSARSEETLRRALLNWPFRADIPMSDVRTFGTVFSPDGRLFCVGGTGNDAQLWRIGSNGVPVKVGQPIKNVSALAFSADSSKLATGNLAGDVQIWSTTTLDEIAGWKLRDAEVWEVEFTLDGTRLLVGSAPGQGELDARYKVSAWSLGKGGDSPKLVSEAELNATVPAVAFSPDGKRMVAHGGPTSPTELWDVATGKLIAELKADRAGSLSEMLLGVALFSSDGRFILTDEIDGRPRVWDGTTGKLLSTLSGYVHNRKQVAISSLAFSPDGNQIITVGERIPVVRIWDTRSGQELWSLKGHSAPVVAAQFSKYGGRVVTASQDGTTQVWDGTAGESLATLQIPELQSHRAQFSPDGKWLLTHTWDKTALWQSGLPDVLSDMRGPQGDPTSVLFSPDGKWVVAVYGQDAWVWETGTGLRVARLQGQESVLTGALISPDGNWVATLGGDGSVWVWNTGTWKVEGRLPGQGGPISAAAFHPDGARLDLVGTDKKLRMWEAASDELLETKATFPANVWSLEHDHEGNRILATSDNLIYMLDATTGDVLFTLAEGEGHIWRAVWSRDGRTILALTLGGLRAWDAGMGEPLSEPRGDFTLGDTLSVDLGKDGRSLLTLSASNRVSVVSAETGSEMMGIPVKEAEAQKVALSPNGRDIAVAGEGVVRVYTCEVCIGVKELLALADKRLSRDLTCLERNKYLHSGETCANEDSSLRSSTETTLLVIRHSSFVIRHCILKEMRRSLKC